MRKKYTYANMLNRRYDICWYIFVDLDTSSAIRDVKAEELQYSQHIRDGFTDEEISVYANSIKNRRKQQGIFMPPAHKKKVYPNELCPCGSGLKYKKCCGKNK